MAPYDLKQLKADLVNPGINVNITRIEGGVDVCSPRNGKTVSFTDEEWLDLQESLGGEHLKLGVNTPNKEE